MEWPLPIGTHAILEESYLRSVEAVPDGKSVNPEILARIQAQTRAAFAEAWRRGATPRPKRKPSEWAEQERLMPPGGPISGGRVVRFDHSFTPHCIEQMDAADDPGVRMIVIWAPVRDGKTNAVCLNIFGRTVTDAPCGVFSVHPTDSDRDKFSNDDVEPMIDLCLADYFVKRKSRDPGRTKEYKKFRGGSLRIVSAGSITAFRGSTVGLLFLHEADALEVESIYKALGRTQGLSDAIIVMESTGTLAPGLDEDGKTIYRSVIHEHFEKGDQRKWFCACQACGHLQVIMYSHFRYPAGHMEKTLCHCEACDYGHDEKEWRKMAAEGRWLPTAGLSIEEVRDIRANHHKAKPAQPEIRSYWRNGFTSLLPKSKGYATKLHQFVAEGEAAKTSKEALKTWTNEIAAELWNPEGEGEPPPDWKSVYDRREKYGLTIPAGGLFLTCFTDVHKNRLEVSWRAWGRKEESWGIDHRVLPGFIGDSEIWHDLRRELARRFQHELGCEVGLGLGFVDGGKFGDEILKFFSEMARSPEPGVYGRVFATKGEGPGAVISRKMKTVDKRLRGYALGTWRAKRVVTDRLRMQPPEGWQSRLHRGEPLWGTDERAGIMHFNEQFSEEYIQQMTRERPRLTWEKGQEVEKWENPAHQRNEGLDLEVGNLAAVRFSIQPWDMLEADLKAQADQAKARQKSAAPAQPHRRRASFVSGWRE